MEEPYAGNPPVRICAGGGPKGSTLRRHSTSPKARTQRRLHPTPPQGSSPLIWVHYNPIFAAMAIARKHLVDDSTPGCFLHLPLRPPCLSLRR